MNQAFFSSKEEYNNLEMKFYGLLNKLFNKTFIN